MVKETNSKLLSIIAVILLSVMLSTVVYSNAYTTNIPSKGKAAVKHKGKTAWTKENERAINSIKMNKVGGERVNAEKTKRKLPLTDPATFVTDGIGNVTSAAGEVNVSKEAISGRYRGDLDGRYRGDLDGRYRAGVESGLYEGEISSVLPPYVDNSTLKYFPPLADQGGTASCAAFSGVYYVYTHMNALAKNLDVKGTAKTNIFSPKFSYNLINGGTDGGIDDLSYVYSQLLKNGALPWNKLPFEAQNYSSDPTGTSYESKKWPTDSALWLEALKNRPSSFGSIDPSTDAGIKEMKLLLNNGYVLQADFYWGNDVLTAYDGGIRGIVIKNNPNSTTDDAQVGKTARVSLNNPNLNSGHAVTIVGYCDDIWTDINNNNKIDTGELGAFLKVDSYLKPDGTSYGYPISQKEWFSYDYLRKTSAVPNVPSTYTTNRAAGLNSVWWMTVNSTFKPELVAKITVNTNRRDTIIARLGVSPGTTLDPVTLVQNDVRISSYDGDLDYMGVFGGEIPVATTNFDNTTTASDITFYLDFSHIKNKICAEGRGQFAWITEFSRWGKTTALTVKSVSVIDLVNNVTVLAKPDKHSTSTQFPTNVAANTILWAAAGYAVPGTSVPWEQDPNWADATAATGDINRATLANATNFWGIGADAGFSLSNLFDQNNSTIWSYTGPDTTNGWVKYQNKSSYKISKYAIISGTNRAYDPGRWVTLASLDGIHWIEVDKHRYQSFTANNQKLYYKFKYPGVYNWYKICEIMNEDKVSPVRIAGIEFIEETP